MVDYVGRKFGAWTVLAIDLKPRPCAGRPGGFKNRMYARCRCTCGRENEMRLENLVAGKTQSCGKCEIASAKRRKAATKHGMCGTREWKTYLQVVYRCTRDIKYIGMLPESWQPPRARGFIAFLSDVGFAPSEKHQLDRIDNAKGYSKENCRWATRNDQMRNRRSNVWLTDGKRTMCLTDWAGELGIGQTALTKRRKRGTLEKIGLRHVERNESLATASA